VQIKEHVIEAIKELKSVMFCQEFTKMFSWQDLENLLNLRPFVNAARFHVLNNDGGYQWQRQSWMSDVNTYPPTLLNDVIKKHHCYFSDASRVNKEVNDVCRDLEKAFTDNHGSADAHIYFNLTDSSDGFGIHWDTSHNLIVQMEGETRFEVWGEDVIGASRMAFLSEQPVINEVLTPGDAILIPWRVYHRATSLTKRLSISFPFVVGGELQPQERHWIKIT
jgi:hypothetical protein